MIPRFAIRNMSYREIGDALFREPNFFLGNDWRVRVFPVELTRHHRQQFVTTSGFTIFRATDRLGDDYVGSLQFFLSSAGNIPDEQTLPQLF